MLAQSVLDGYNVGGTQQWVLTDRCASLPTVRPVLVNPGPWRAERWVTVSSSLLTVSEPKGRWNDSAGHRHDLRRQQSAQGPRLEVPDGGLFLGSVQ